MTVICVCVSARPVRFAEAVLDREDRGTRAWVSAL